jgi:hypothetical protein
MIKGDSLRKDGIKFNPTLSNNGLSSLPFILSKSVSGNSLKNVFINSSLPEY